MNPKDEFIEIEHRIRALTTILKNLNHHVTPSPGSKDAPSFLFHLANLLTTGDKKCHEAKKVVAVTGFLHPEGSSTLIVTQNPFSKSGVEDLRIEDVSKSEKSFDEIVNLDRDDNVVLDEYISDLWTALTYYPSHPQRYTDLHIFIVYRSYRKLFKRVRQDTRTWKVHVAEKIIAWTPRPNELKATRWFKMPDWLGPLKNIIPSERLEMMNTRKGEKFMEVEFSSATVAFWAWLLGDSLLKLEGAVERAEKKIKNDTYGFKKDLVTITTWCHVLRCYVNWSARIVETLLTRTSLADMFTLPTTIQCNAKSDDGDDCDNVDHSDNADGDDANHDSNYDNNIDDDSADMSRETNESDGHLVLRHLRAMLAWSAALDSLTSRKYLSVIAGKLDIGLVHVPHSGDDMTGIDAITADFFKRFPPRSEFFRDQDTTNLEMGWKPKFTGTTHAEATLMGLLRYFSEPNISNRVDYCGALQDSTVAERMEALIGSASTATNVPIGVGKKCCWCCSALGSILAQHDHISINLPGSHGVVYPWSPPRVGLDLSVLRVLEEQLWTELYAVIKTARFRVPFSRQSSGTSSVDDVPKIFHYSF